jgi:predicted HTH transcriptional regulator
MQVPDRLEGWTIEVIRGLAAEGKGETDLFDFKTDLGLKDPASGRKLTKACCAFANARGGFLVYGVSQRDAGGWQVDGVPPNREFAAEFGKGVRADCWRSPETAGI